MPQQKKKEEEKPAPDPAEGIGGLGRFIRSTRDTQRRGGNPIQGIQDFGQRELERKRQEEERKKKEAAEKAKNPVQTGPSPGILSRLYKRVFGEPGLGR